MKYEKPEIEIIEFEIADVITASKGGLEDAVTGKEEENPGPKTLSMFD